MEIVNMKQRPGTVCRMLKSLLILTVVLMLIFVLMCVLLLFTNATSVMGFKSTQIILTENMEILDNSITALMVGILCTAILQQPIILLTILITMVTNKSIHPLVATQLIMGMNIGCHITPTLVSMVLFYKRVQFKQSIKTILLPLMVSCFTALILLPLEFATGFMHGTSEKLATESMKSVQTYQQYGLLHGVLKPLTHYILKVDVINSYNSSTDNVTQRNSFQVECSGIISGLHLSCMASSILVLFTTVGLGIFTIVVISYLVSKENQSTNNLNLVPTTKPNPLCSHLKGYLMVVIGFMISLVVQDNVFMICILLPLSAFRRYRSERLFPFILGSNIGAAVSLLLSTISLQSPSQTALQMIFCHLIFNLCNLVLFYIIPYSSRIPIQFSEILSTTFTAHRWFTVICGAFVFLGLPVSTYGLSLAGQHYVIVFISSIVLILLIAASISFMQLYTPSCLPESMRTWKFLPKCFRSLQFYEVCASKVQKLVTSPVSRKSMNPDQSAIRGTGTPEPKDVYVTIPEEPSCCCCPLFPSRMFYTKYSLTEPTQTSTPKCPPKPTKTPVLVKYAEPEKEDYESELMETIGNYDPREALNFGTLGFEDETYSSSEEASEDPIDFTTTTSSDSSYSYASVSGDTLQLLHHEF